MPNAQPGNILLITASNHRADCFGFGGRNVRTPHLDRLARSGTRFSACIRPSHVGQPARASILTGQLPLTHGIADNGVDLSDALTDVGFAQQRAKAGYVTGLIGKAHFSTRNSFAPTGRPECRSSGHLSRQRQPLSPPNGSHYERWLATRRQPREAHDLWGDSTTTANRRRPNMAFGVAPSMAQQYLGWRSGHRLPRCTPTSLFFLSVGVVLRSTLE